MQDFTDDRAFALQAAAPQVDPDPDPQPQPQPRTLAVRFTGSGSEYFRIWIVNLLLLLLTLGLYWPWAKARRLRYFHANTLVGGHALAFHGDPRQMFKGFVLVLALFGAYSAATNTSLAATVVAVLAIGALWPALFQRSMRFRLANTSWRGLRLRFAGTVGDAYRALAPALVVAGAGALSSILQRQHMNDAAVLAWSAGGVMLLGLVVGPWALWRLKCYQHRHYAWGPVQTDLRLPLGAVYTTGLKAGGVALLVLLAVIALFVGVGALSTGAALSGAKQWLMWVPMVLMVLLWPGLFAYVTSRWQNLLWSATGCTQLQFHSELHAKALFGLTLKNGLLLALTLGLYWPFAAVAKARLRLEAVRLEFSVDPDTLAAQALADGGEAVGDAAADLLGVDIGL
ncbi:MAG: YjgN family protein [Rhodoferax sp.]